MFQTLSVISVALLLTLTASSSAEGDRNLLSKLNSNVELNKVASKPVASVSSEPLKTAETRPGSTDFITSSHTEQSYSSSSSFESPSGVGGGPGPSSAELGGGRGPASVSSQAASSTSYQVSGESSENQQLQSQPQQQQQSPQQQHQQGSPEVYSSAEDSSAVSSPSSSPSGYGRPDLNEVDFSQANGYQVAGGRTLPHPYGSSYEIAGQTYDLQRNPEPAYDNGASGEYNSAQANVANEGGYNLNQDTNAYEDTNSNEDEGSAYRTQEPEGSSAPLAAPGSGPENHHQQQQQQQQQSPSSAEQGGQGPRKTSTLASSGPIPDYGGFRPVIKSQNIPVPPIPGPQRPTYALAHGEPFRSVSVNYEPPKSIYSFDGPNSANTGSYNTKSFPVYGQQGPRDQQQQQQQPQVATAPNSHAGYGLDYASGKPYGGDLSVKPYSADPNGNVKKIIPMTIGYDELVKPQTPSSAPYHTAGSPPSSPHHGSEYIVSHGPPQHSYEQGPPQGPYGQPQSQPTQGHPGQQGPQGHQGQQGPPQFTGGYGQPVTYQATPIGYAQSDGYDQQSGPIGYEQSPAQQIQPQQQGPSVGTPINYGQQVPLEVYEQSRPVQGPHHQGPPQGSPHSHPYPHPPPQASGQLSPPPPPQQVQQTPSVYGPPSGPGQILSNSPAQYEQEPNYGPPQSSAPVNYEQQGPGEYQAAPPKPAYEQTTTFVESSGYPGNLGPAYGTIKEGPSPLTASVSGPASGQLEGYSGNMAQDNEYYPSSSYDSLENSAGPSSYPASLPASLPSYNSQGGSYSSGGYSLPDDSYMSSLFGFPTYDVTSGKGNPYAAGSNPIPSPASPGSSGSQFSSLGSSGLSGSSSGKPLGSSFLPSIKLTGNGIKLSGFGSSLTGGLGSINQAIASTLGSGLSGVTGPGVGYRPGSPGLNGASPLHHSAPNSGLGGPLSSFYNNLSGLGSPFGGLGGLNYGTAASKLIPQAIRAPFRTMYRALMGNNGAPNPLNG